MALRNSLISTLRHCPGCQSWLGLNDPFCKTCVKSLILQKNIQVHGNAITNHYILTFCFWRWEKKNLLIAKALKAQKKGLFPAFSSLIAEHLIVSLLGNPRWQKPRSIVYPVSMAPYDHSFQWALALQKLLNVPIFPIQKSSSASIKTQTRQQRRNIKFHKLQTMPKSPILFTDDILTTGSTTLAVHKALTKPKKFQAVYMAYRPLS